MTGRKKPPFVAGEDTITESVEIRYTIHRAPELAFQERQTAAFVAERLRTLGLEVTETNGLCRQWRAWYRPRRGGGSSRGRGQSRHLRSRHGGAGERSR